ncbi:hypothetical protein Tco_0009114 [Tanacetum coccineum]
MAYQRLDFTRKRVRIIPNTAYPSIYIRHQLIRRIHQLDMTYRPFLLEQRIDLYSLNNVFVLPNNTAYSINSIRHTDLQQTIRRIQLTMTEQNDYISVTRKNCISNDNEGRMINRNFVEIQGAILVKIRDNTFNGIIGENAFEHINKFLKVVGPIKINRVEKFIQKFYQLSYDNEKMEAEEDDDLDDITDILKIEDNLFDYETPLYELADGKLKEETLIHKANVEESWGDATPGVMKFYAWLIDSFGNFHELDYNVLVKLQECWWKINAHEVVPFTHLENYDQRPYANFKTKKAHDPYLDINRIFGRNNDTRNVDNIQDHQEHEER